MYGSNTGAPKSCDTTPESGSDDDYPVIFAGDRGSRTTVLPTDAGLGNARARQRNSRGGRARQKGPAIKCRHSFPQLSVETYSAR